VRIDREHLKRALNGDTRLRRVSEYVQDNISEPISLADVATIASLETKYFSAYFLRHSGQPFSIWLANERVRAAQALLSSADLSLRRVALLVGFGSLRTFQRHFKRLTGMSARQYRRRLVDPYTTGDAIYTITDG